MEKLERYIDLAIDFAPKLVLALIVLIAGFFIINRIVKFVKDRLFDAQFDESLAPFLTSILSEGSLGNFASGVLVLLFRPYAVGDLIEVEGKKGWVQEIQIFNTIIKTVTNQNVIIPNSKLTSDTITNHSSNGFIRVDLSFAVPYEENFDHVEQAILNEAVNIEHVLKDPAPSVGIDEFDSHNIKVGLYLYTEPEHYWSVYYDANLAIKQALGKNNIKMAYSEGIELGAIGAS